MLRRRLFLLMARVVLDPDKRTIQRVAANTTKVPQAKPRLCVALDYLHLGGRPPITLRATTSRPQDPTPHIWPLELSAQMKKLDCLAGVKIWVWEKSGGGEGPSSVSGWKQIPCTIEPAKKAGASDQCVLNKALAQSLLQPGAKMFCEVSLKTPTPAWAAVWAAEMNCTDSWLFPLEYKRGQSDTRTNVHFLERPSGERGEIPDWEWLYATFGQKYPRPNSITTAKKVKK